MLIFQLLLVSLSMIKITQKENSKYTIIGYSHTDKYHIKYFDVICICGKKKKINMQCVKKSISCGCQKEYGWLKTHKKTKSSEYKCWQSIKDRCYNVNNSSYYLYGERGIKMSESWLLNFDVFLSDMGSKPNSKCSIDRIDVNGNYEKNNCEWVDSKRQNNNKRNNYILTYKGITLTRSEWADLIGVNVKTLASRCRANKPIEQILKEYKNG